MCIVWTPEVEGMEVNAMVVHSKPSWILKTKITRRLDKTKHGRFSNGRIFLNAVGLDTDKYTGLFSMYIFRYETDLGIRKAACRLIPCACLTSFEVLKNVLGCTIR